MGDLVAVIGGPLASPEALDALAHHAVHARGAHAASTERALKADTAVFTAWCAAQGLPALPAAPTTVAAFIDAMAAVKAPATVRRYVSSIATFHRAAALPNPATVLEVKLALKRMHRAHGRAQTQAAPLVRRQMIWDSEGGLLTEDLAHLAADVRRPGCSGASVSAGWSGA